MVWLALGCGPGTLSITEPTGLTTTETTTTDGPTDTHTGTECTPCTIIEGGIVPFLPSFAPDPDADRRNIVDGSSVLGLGRLRVSLRDPDEETTLPSSQGIWEVTLQDMLGRNLDDADGIDLDDLIRILVGSDPDRLPHGVVVSAGLSAGPVTASNPGVAVQLVGSSTGNLMGHAVNTGTGWTISRATATSLDTARGVLQVTVGTDDTQARVSGVAWTSDHEILSQANVHTSPSTSNLGAGDFDRIFLGVGWTGDGEVDVDVGCGALLLRPREVPFDPFF